MTANKVALIMAGGTGGHIFPGLALAEALKAEGWSVHWMGTADRMEADIVPKYKLPIHFIDVKGIRGNGLKRLLSLPMMLLKAFFQARRVIKQIKPNIVVGFGGYASGPGGLAARSCGVPLMIHEQNAVLGMTNKYLSKLAQKTLLAFPNALKGITVESVEVIGNPIRQDILVLNQNNKRDLGPDTDIRILVIGGSLGARALNESLPAIFSAVCQRGFHLNVEHQVGKGNREQVQAYYDSCKEFELSVTVNEFIDDMPSALNWCDLVICRAGALTVSELAASGNAGLFVPLPHAVDDHQTANANYLVEHGAGKLVPQNEINEKLPNLLTELLSDPKQINQMQHKAKQQANLTTTEQMLQLCQKLELSS